MGMCRGICRGDVCRAGVMYVEEGYAEEEVRKKGGRRSGIYIRNLTTLSYEVGENNKLFAFYRTSVEN